MPNSFAILMLTLWPFVTGLMYARLPASTAVIWSVLAGYLLLPQGVGLDLPALPPLSKQSIPPLFGYLFASLVAGRPITLLPRNPVAQICVVLLLVGPFLTIATNGDPIYINSEKTLPALRPYDGASMLIGQLGALCIWALAREFLRDAATLRQFALALVVAWLWYTLPMLYEVRMSPQLHIMIYGFFQHDFVQMMRQGGFRPIVFLEHGLVIALMTAIAVLLAAVLGRSGPPEQKGRWHAATAYLLAVLVLCKSVAALIYAVLLLPVVLFLDGRRMVRIAMLLGVLVMTYPVLRTLDVIPTDRMVEIAAKYSAERAQSLQFRFANEDALLERAMQRPLFGWGGWERSSIHDAISGDTVSVTDGLWTISMGYSGFVGFLAQFGLLALPIFLVGAAFRGTGREIPVLVGGLALVLALNLVDLLPNSAITPVTWMLSGAMLGYLERLNRKTVAAADPVAHPAGLIGRRMEGPRTLL